MFYTRCLLVLTLAAMVWSQQQQQPQQIQKEEEPDINTIPGVPGKDYPNFHDVPRTNFACSGKIAGYYADTEARCQVWHYCSTEGLMESFLCPNGTIYSQERRVCEWYYDVDCERTNKFLDVNKDLYIIPNSTRTNVPRSEQLQDRQPIQQSVQQPVQQPAQQPAQQPTQFTNKRKRFTSW